ncbi:MAG TPA: polyprenyl synthetase family protein [Candidatus Binatia bacterium]|nr:polyprenyl synthetase family protein [Candidatus Binatia bacterium]
MSVIADANSSAGQATIEAEAASELEPGAPPALPASLSRHLPLVDEALRWAVPPTTSPLGKMCAYHLGWISPDGQPATGGGGKLFRAALTLWACEACGGEADWAVPAAAAAELVHNFTLVHDDIQDGDETRRHRATVWAVWGQAQGINVGDGLFAIAYVTLLAPGPRGDRRMRAAHSLSQAIVDVIEGQSLDLALEGRPDTPRSTYLRLITGKTGALLGACLEMGAIVAGAGAKTVTNLRSAGRLLGQTFQIRDDWLGTFGDPERTGKARGSDLARRKTTFPVISAYSRASYAEQRELCDLYAEPDGQASEERIREILGNLGEPGATATAAEQTAQAAIAAVSSSGLAARWVDDFAAIAGFVAHRLA